MITDLTKDPPKKVIWRFALPMVVSIIFQQMYNICDSIIAGQFINDNALSAVSASYNITMLFMSFAYGSYAGCAVIISQYFGAHKLAKMKNAVYTSLISSVAVSIMLMIIGFIFCDPLLKVLGTPASIFNDSSAYLKIYVAGFLFLFVYNICTGIFTALGDSKTPLYFLIGSSLGNVILDIVFVSVFDLGVPGIAWATFIAQGIACILAFITLLKRLSSIPVSHYIPKFSFIALKDICFVAIPSIIQNAFVSVGGILIQKIINDFGYSAVGAYGAAFKINTFAINCLCVFANANSSYAAQNIGAGNIDRVSEGYKVTVKYLLLSCIPFTLLYMIFPEFLMGFFTKEKTPEVLKIGSDFLRLASPFYFILSLKLISDGVFRSGKAMKAFMLTTFSDLALRVFFAYILSPSLGCSGINLSWPIGWVLSSVLSFVLYKKGYWKKNISKRTVKNDN